MNNHTKAFLCLFLLTFIVVFNQSCYKVLHPWGGISIVDDIGVPYGQCGKPEKNPAWTKKEKELLDFSTDLSLEGTENGNNAKSHIYPIPTKNVLNISMQMDEKVLLKVVIVDDKLDVLYQSAKIVDKKYSIYIDVSDRNKFKNGEIYRVYYSYSAENNPNFFKDAQNIAICDNSDGTCSCLNK